MATTNDVVEMKEDPPPAPGGSTAAVENDSLLDDVALSLTQVGRRITMVMSTNVDDNDDVSTNIDDNVSLTQDTHSSFFALLRDLFMLKDGLLTMQELDKSLSAWQDSPIAALNPWYPECSDPSGWRALIPR